MYKVYSYSCADCFHHPSCRGWLGVKNQLSLCFQKRLFIEPYVNLNDPVECDLVFHQLIQDVFEERIPITPAEAVSTFMRVHACACVSTFMRMHTCVCECDCVVCVCCACVRERGGVQRGYVCDERERDRQMVCEFVSLSVYIYIGVVLLLVCMCLCVCVCV